MPGWLPPAKGTPVAFGGHLDRSKKQLLRGRTATIHGWALHEDEVLGDEDEEVLSHLPRVIVLDFHAKEWRLPGWEPADMVLGWVSEASSFECETHPVHDHP
eukprot:5680586-Pyramimonas_sp.AAC.1